jgi:hypothetical protein
LDERALVLVASRRKGRELDRGDGECPSERQVIVDDGVRVVRAADLEAVGVEFLNRVRSAVGCREITRAVDPKPAVKLMSRLSFPLTPVYFP